MQKLRRQQIDKAIQLSTLNITLHNVMNGEIELTYSPLNCKITRDGDTLEINIFKSPDTDWFLEIIDLNNNSTCWEEQCLQLTKKVFWLLLSQLKEAPFTSRWRALDVRLGVVLEWQRKSTI
jgi:hypothetical protein